MSTSTKVLGNNMANTIPTATKKIANPITRFIYASPLCGLYYIICKKPVSITLQPHCSTYRQYLFLSFYPLFSLSHGQSHPEPCQEAW